MNGELRVRGGPTLGGKSEPAFRLLWDMHCGAELSSAPLQPHSGNRHCCPSSADEDPRSRPHLVVQREADPGLKEAL